MTPPWSPLRDAHQTVVKGDDCKAADGRALEWRSAEWPDLTGATFKIVVGFNSANIFGNQPTTDTGATATQVGAVWTVSMDLTAEQTKAFAEGTYDYTLVATLADKDVVTLAYGHLAVLSEPGQAPLLPLT